MKTARIIFIAATLLALAAVRSFAAGAPSVEARLGAAQIYEGESVAYEVHVTNGKEGVKPDLSDLKADFDIAENGQSTYSSSFTFIVNGQNMSPDSGTTIAYRYQLTPKRIGNLSIPPPFILQDGKKIFGRSFAMQVIAVEKQDMVLMEIQPSKPRVIPRQPFEVSLKIWVKPLPSGSQDPLMPLDPPRLHINWMDAPEGLKARDETIEWLRKNLSQSPRGIFISYKEQTGVLGLATGREKRLGLDGKEVDYFTYELTRTFIAQRAGTFEFGPATLKGVFASGIRNNQYTGQPVFAVAPAKRIEVVQPKAAPANFNGCFGHYDLRATANAKELRVGDPLQLKLEFERSSTAGLLEDVTAPDLTANAKLTADFTVVDKAPPGQTSGNIKSYSYTLRPKKAGVSIPPIPVTVFDMQSEKYDELAFNSIPLNVSDAPQLRADEVVSGVPVGAGRSIGGHEKGVFQNIADPVEIGKPALNPTLYMAAVIGLWIFYALGFTALFIHRKRAGDSALQRRMRAQAEAASQLGAANAALKADDGTGAALAIHRALTGLIGLWNGVPPEGMTPHDASTVLQKAGASSGSRDETVRLLDSIEAAKYGSMPGLQAAALVQAAEKLIPILQKEMKS